MFFATTNTPPDYALAAAIGSPLLIFGVVVLWANRVLLGDTSRFVTHGGKGGFRQGTPGSKLAAISIVIFTLFSSILPLLALIAVSLTRFWTGSIDPHTWTLDAYRQLVHEPAITSAIWNSVSLSLAAVAIALPAGYITASILRRGRQNRITSPILDFIVAMPLSIPAVIFGVGFLLVYTNKPLVLYGTKWVLVLVYVTLMIPFSTRMQLAGMAALGDSYNEASRVCGAGLIRTQLSIMAPLMRGTFGGAAALMFVLLTHEFASITARARVSNAGYGDDPLRLLRERHVSARRVHLHRHGPRHCRRRRSCRHDRRVGSLQAPVKLGLSADEVQVQEEARAFLAEHCPDPSELPHALDERIAYLREWQARCYEAGLVGRAWPAEFGGGGRSSTEQIVVDQELAGSGAPEFVAIVGLDVLGPALLAFGTEEQKQRHVAPILSADEIWCQGFSEPEAGSDLASLRTNGGRDGGWLPAERPEDLGLVGAVRPLVRGTRTYRPGRAAAQRHLATDRRHGIPRARRAADGSDHGSRGVQRAVLR